MIVKNTDFFARQRRLRFRGIKYSVLSIILTIVLFVTAGCAAMLRGDDKDAYDRLEIASSYFKYPSSVKIAMGEMSGGTLYCTIQAKNGFGIERYDTYRVSSSGYPTESTDSRCYSEKLDFEAINAALAAHYGLASSSTNSTFSFDRLTGGFGNMELIIVLIVLGVFLALNGLLASKASDMAQDKGYEKRTWFHMCFWLGPISYIIVAAMPDRVMQQKLDKTNKLLEDMLNVQKTSTATHSNSQQNDTFSLPEL